MNAGKPSMPVFLYCQTFFSPAGGAMSVRTDHASPVH
jgi:hypothetical protein